MKEVKLSTPVRKLYIFQVTGFGEFPFDMLRYDACWPHEQADVNWLHARSQRTVTLVSTGKPTVARWNSFLWSVSA